MNVLTSAFHVQNLSAAMPLIFAGILLLILVVSFRSRAVVFTQYLSTMTGIQLKPADVARVYREKGKDGVREFFLDLIIREDLKQGPIEIPGTDPAADLEVADRTDKFLINR